MARFAGVLLLIGCMLAGAGPGAAADQSAEDAAALCERAIVAGARRGGAPVDVLQAVALTETGRMIGGRLRPWPWAINREGEGHWFASREEALAFARASVAAGRRSFDVGCFQINYHWHGHAFASLDAMFDQETGGTYAAQFLRSLHAEFGDWSAAAGAYHSRTPAFAERYRARFERMLAGLGSAPLKVAATEAEAEAEVGTSEPAAPRRSRTRMAARPKIITLAGAAPRPEVDARVAAIRVERGRIPAGAAGAGAQPGPVVVSARDAPL
jgi:hypothetical protein